MADNTPQPTQVDLVNLDEATTAPLESGLNASGGESILNAAEVFQQQLEQMTTWKQKLGTQMDLLRRDGIKLMERQKTLAQEKQVLTQDRAALEKQRDEIQRMQGEMSAEGTRLNKLAGDLEQTQQQLAKLHAQREQAEREITARESKLQELEAQHFIEDVRLKEGVEQLEIERRNLNGLQRQSTQEREAVARQVRELEDRTAALAEQNRVLGGREEQLNAALRELENAQNLLRQRQDEATAREKALAERIQAAEADLQNRAARALAEEQRVVHERQSLARQRQEFQKKFETFEQEQAEQLDALSKQTKRLSERRGQVEAAEANLEQTLTARITQATQALKEQLAQHQSGHSGRVVELEKQLQQAEANAQVLSQHEKALNEELANMRAQLATLNQELEHAKGALDQASRERSTLANQLAEQMEEAKREARQWEKALEEAQAAGENNLSQRAKEQNTAAREKVDAFKEQIRQLQQAKDELEFQLEVRAEESAKQLEAERAQLAKQIELRNEEIAELKVKLEAAQHAAGNPTADAVESAQVHDLVEQVQKLEVEKQGLTQQLASLQDSLNHHQEEAQLTKSVLEGMVMELEQKNSALEAGKAQQQATLGGPRLKGEGDDPGVAKQTSWQRQRLLRQAKALRTFRLQIRETQGTLEKGRAEIAQQREQVRVRRDNLEQVKRLLEKQEMVMARKLADHNAIKTVCAVGMFVIMVLAAVFFGVYRFVHPVYRSEAVVQLAVPANLAGPELEVWNSKQMAFVRSEEVTQAAWKILRSPDEHYGMHDVREEWVNSLGTHLNMSIDNGAKTMAVHYTGPDAEGVSQVSNALATAYATPGMRETSEDSKALGLGAQVVAQATVPLYPVEDSRLTTCLTVVAVVLLASLVLVMVFRHFISRQLREIDDMAEGESLADAGDEAPAPAIE